MADSVTEVFSPCRTDTLEPGAYSALKGIRVLHTTQCTSLRTDAKSRSQGNRVPNHIKPYSTTKYPCVHARLRFDEPIIPG